MLGNVTRICYRWVWVQCSSSNTVHYLKEVMAEEVYEEADMEEHQDEEVGDIQLVDMVDPAMVLEDKAEVSSKGI